MKFISLRCKKGQGAVEYAIITVAVLVVLALVLLPGSPFAGAVQGVFGKIGTEIAKF